MRLLGGWMLGDLRIIFYTIPQGDVQNIPRSILTCPLDSRRALGPVAGVHLRFSDGQVKLLPTRIGKFSIRGGFITRKACSMR